MSERDKRVHDAREREQAAYEREQELTELYRQALEAIREDAEQAVAKAVRSAAPTPADWEGIVRRVVREEMAGVAPTEAVGPGPVSVGVGEAGSNLSQTWVAALAGAVAAAMLVGAGWWVGRLSAPGPEGAADAAGVPSVATDTIAPSGEAMPDGAADTTAGAGSDTLAGVVSDTTDAPADTSMDGVTDPSAGAPTDTSTGVPTDTTTDVPTDTPAGALTDTTSDIPTDTSIGVPRDMSMDISAVPSDMSMDISADVIGEKANISQPLPPDTPLDIEADISGLEISLEDVR